MNAERSLEGTYLSSVGERARRCKRKTATLKQFQTAPALSCIKSGTALNWSRREPRTLQRNAPIQLPTIFVCSGRPARCPSIVIASEAKQSGASPAARESRIASSRSLRTDGAQPRCEPTLLLSSCAGLPAHPRLPSFMRPRRGWPGRRPAMTRGSLRESSPMTRHDRRRRGSSSSPPRFRFNFRERM